MRDHATAPAENKFNKQRLFLFVERRCSCGYVASATRAATVQHAMAEHLRHAEHVAREAHQ